MVLSAMPATNLEAGAIQGAALVLSNSPAANLEAGAVLCRMLSGAFSKVPPNGKFVQSTCLWRRTAEKKGGVLALAFLQLYFISGT